MSYTVGMRTQAQLIELLKSRSSSEVAAATGITRRTIDRYKSGKVLPSFESMQKIAAIYPMKLRRTKPVEA